MTTILKTSILIIFSISSMSFASRTEVKVGAYQIPPFYKRTNESSSGIVLQLVNYLNEKQENFYFKVIDTTPRRRYRDLENGVFDIIFFENPSWGWGQRKSNYLESKVFAIGKDFYVAKRRTELKDQQKIFDSLDKKTILLKSGFHYGFLSLKSYDVKKDNLIYTNSHWGNIQNILKGKGDITVINDSFLKLYFKKNPEMRKKLIVSKKADQTHYFKVLSRVKGPISIKEIESLFPLMKSSKELSEILDFK